MNEISIYSTPTFRFSFKTFNVSDLTDAVLTVKCDNITIHKYFSESFIEDDLLCWTLSQEESKTLTVDLTARAMCDWKVGTKRGRSKIRNYKVTETGVEEIL